LFIVIQGSVTACISSIKNPNVNSFDVAHIFKEGEIIHLFSNQEKIIDHTSLIFENIKLSFIQDKNTIVYSLDVSEFKKFIEERSNLTSLDVFMHLKMSELLANHIYFEGMYMYICVFILVLHVNLICYMILNIRIG
jgi:hypothetical protein